MDNQTQNSNVIENADEEQQYIPLHKSYCRECGAMISSKAFACPKCGASTNQSTIKDDTASTGLKVLSFFIPLVGLILYIMQFKDTPNAAKEYGKWALIGFCVGVALCVIYYVIIVIAITGMFNSMSSTF